MHLFFARLALVPVTDATAATEACHLWASAEVNCFFPCRHIRFRTTVQHARRGLLFLPLAVDITRPSTVLCLARRSLPYAQRTFTDTSHVQNAPVALSANV